MHKNQSTRHWVELDMLILLDLEFRPRVANFGLAKTLQRETEVVLVAGTYGYIAICSRSVFPYLPRFGGISILAFVALP